MGIFTDWYLWFDGKWCVIHGANHPDNGELIHIIEESYCDVFCDIDAYICPSCVAFLKDRELHLDEDKGEGG